MFKITPIQDKTRQNEICQLCGATFRPDAFAYQMYDMDSGEIMGMSQFEITECGYIYDIKEAPDRDDFEAMFILGRQTMNFIDTCGAHTCYIDKNAGDERLIRSIGFKDVNGNLFVDMDGMFDGNCSGHK
jgi:rubredoxin